MMTKLQKLLDLHAGLLEHNPHCYFELAYTRQTDWMAWICSNAKELDPNRKVLAKGQGDTPEEAAAVAIESFVALDQSPRPVQDAPDSGGFAVSVT